MEANEAKDSDSHEEYLNNIKNILKSGEIPIMYISELITDKGLKLRFSHYGEDKEGKVKPFYILD